MQTAVIAYYAFCAPCNFYNLYVRMFLFLAKVAICDVGSDPMDKIQTSGVRGSDSDHVASKSNICISLYSGPRDSVLRKDKLVISF